MSSARSFRRQLGQALTGMFLFWCLVQWVQHADARQYATAQAQQMERTAIWPPAVRIVVLASDRIAKAMGEQFALSLQDDGIPYRLTSVERVAPDGITVRSNLNEWGMRGAGATSLLFRQLGIPNTQRIRPNQRERLMIIFGRRIGAPPRCTPRRPHGV